MDEGDAGQGGSVRRGRGEDESFNGRGGGARAGRARGGGRGGATGRADAPLILGRISSTKRILDDA